MKKKVLIAAGIIVLIIAIIAVNIVRNQGSKSVAVKTATATQEKIDSVLFLDGKADINDKRDIRAKGAGVIKEVKVESGAAVTAGQPLIYLDTTDLEIQKQQLTNQLNLAKDKLNQAKSAPAIPGQSNDLAIKAAQNDVNSAQAAVDKINNQIADAVIKSPIDGTVLARNAQPGMMADPTQVLMTVGNVNNLIIKSQVSEIDLLKVKKGQKVKITGDSFPDKTYQGEVTDTAQVPTASSPLTAAAAGTSDSATYQVTIKVTDTDTLLRPGFSTNLEVVTDSRDSALVIPLDALVEKDDKKVVYINDKGVVKEKQVKTGISNDTKTEITEGLSKGDKVILSPDVNVIKNNVKVTAND